MTLTLTLILVLLVFNEFVSGFCYLPICALYLTMLLLVEGFMDLLTSAKSPFDSVGEHKLGFYAFMVLTLHLFFLLKYLGRAAHEIDFHVDG